MSLAKLGLMPFIIGQANVKQDWIYVDNLVMALLLASMALLDDIPGRKGSPIAAGKPYFVSDGKDPCFVENIFFNCCFVSGTIGVEQLFFYRILLKRILLEICQNILDYD